MRRLLAAGRTVAGVLGRNVRIMRTPAAVYRAQQLALAPVSQAASNLIGLSWINAQDDTPFETAATAATFGVRLTSLRDFLDRRARGRPAPVIKAGESPRLQRPRGDLACGDMTPPAVIASERDFACAFSDDGLRVDRERARLEARFRFTRSVVRGREPVRRFELAAVCLVDDRGVTYRLLEATPGGEAAGGSGQIFLRAHRGVLVGSGALNNRLLTLLLEFTEHPDGTATAEVIAARLDAP